MNNLIMQNEEIFTKVQNNMDLLVEQNADWTLSVSAKVLEEARHGKIDLQLGFPKSVPNEWFGKGVKGKRILCLAAAGGLQAPILAAAGAVVTVLDISEKMLDKDRIVAKKENLKIELLQGNMCDLSGFAADTFDFIINPVSLIYVPDVSVVFNECYRVLKHKGSLIMAAPNPIGYVCDYIDDGVGYYKAVNKMPYKSFEHNDQGDWIEFGHTMGDYIGGQIACGFTITGYTEIQMDDITDIRAKILSTIGSLHREYGLIS